MNKPHRQDRRWSTAWSPEQIAHRLEIDFPDDECMRISHEAIYQSLFIQGRVRSSASVVDEVGYLPFEQDAANLFFQLVSSRYEHASLVPTSNLPFSSWGGVFEDQAVAAATIDRIVHHADDLALKGASYRLRGRGIDSLPSIGTTTSQDES